MQVTLLPMIRATWPRALALVGTALASCASDGPGATGSADCAAALVHDGHRYMGRGGVKRDPATTGRHLAAVLPGCDDSRGQRPVEPDTQVEVEELAGIPVGTALLWNGAVYLREGWELPAAARPWFRAPRCSSDGPFDLTADWLGVTGPNEARVDGDLRPPYTLDVHVTAGPDEYVGTTLRVRADTATAPGLGPRDVKSSLWKGRRVVARVACDDGRFRALSLRVP